MAEPGIPSLEDLESAVLRHRFEDMFNPPGLTNFLGAAQVDHDIFALRSVNFPPVGSGDTLTGALFVDGRLLRSLAPQVTVRWRPDRVLRSARIGDLELKTLTACAPGEPGVVVELTVTNLGPSKRSVRLGFALASRATITGKPWRRAKPPSRANKLVVDGARRALVGTCPKSAATCVQGFDATPQWRAPNMAEFCWELAEGESRRLGYALTLAPSLQAAKDSFDRLVFSVPRSLAAAEELWRREIAHVFEPGAGSFTGSLPVLESESEALRRLYWTSILGVLYMRRDSPHARLGRSYDTLMPRYWQGVTFIWDYSLSSVLHALLDPATMRRHIEHWVRTGVHSHYGTEWLTGKPVGVWYSVNDSAMVRLAFDYVRWSGDTAWLARPLRGPSGHVRLARDHLISWALHWKNLTGREGLADYGGKRNLLECVSTYKHQVAGLNAMNVWCMRVAAEMCERSGDTAKASHLKTEAAALAVRLLDLYVEGGGYWRARQRDGSYFEVKHCYDLMTAGFALAGDLSPRARQDIVDFFCRELRSDTWMRALAASDPDAAYSLRPDHQWDGAYTAWPAEVARALYRLGAGKVVADWVPGLARSTAEGPFAQGHFVEGLVPSSHDGAPKGPPQHPYLMDWACGSAGSFAGMIIEGAFGVDVGLDGSVRAAPRLAGLDPSARLRRLVVGGRTYDVSAAGASPRPRP
jgi:hypothetical protein